jgi:putative acetyltransferase
LALVAELANRVVGHVMISYASLEEGGLRRPIAQLSPLAVAPEFQRQGIGSALVREVTSRARERGEPMVVLQGSPTFYGRLGFEPAGPLGVRMTLPAWAPVEAAQAIRFETYDPTFRGLVVDPPAFAEIARIEAERTAPPSSTA